MQTIIETIIIGSCNLVRRFPKLWFYAQITSCQLVLVRKKITVCDQKTPPCCNLVKHFPKLWFNAQITSCQLVVVRETITACDQKMSRFNQYLAGGQISPNRSPIRGYFFRYCTVDPLHIAVGFTSASDEQREK